MRRRFIIGLSIIFTVVLLGGGLVSNVMGKLYRINTARFLMDRVTTTIGSLEIQAIQAVKKVNATYTLEEAGKFQERMDEIKGSMVNLNRQIVSQSFGENSCGICHSNTTKLVSELHKINAAMETSFAQLVMFSNLVINENGEGDHGQALMDMERTLGKFQGQVDSMRNILLPMTQHINEEVSREIASVRKTQNITILLTILLVLIGVIILSASLARPIKHLNDGTEAIVNGDYDFRINLKGRDELTVLADRFNYMAEVISNRERRLEEQTAQLADLNRTLEKKVEDRTRVLKEKQEEINSRYLEIESANEKLQESYQKLQTTAEELEEAQAKLQDNYDILKAMNEELQRANEVKNRFLSIMSHELRTPLTVINGYLSLVLDKNYGNPTKELRDIITVVKDQGHHQLGLIEDLLDLTRIEAGEYKLSRQAFPPDSLIKKAVENFRPAFEAKEIEVLVDTEDDMSIVHWDFHKMLQVFQNLLDNALKFTPQGGEISLSARSKSEFIELRVKDSGIGIPKNYLGQVFDRFYQVDSSPTRPFGGSGLGLSIVREIVLAHHGKIFVESDEGEGTCFLILMPIGEPERQRFPEPPGAGPEMKGVEAAPKGNGESILVVDDDETFLKMMKLFLPREGYNVTYTSDSTKTIHYAKKHKADIIMLDLMMPKLDGYEVCRQIREDAEISEIPVMVVSAAGGRDVVRKVFQAGADVYLIKPFDQQDLLQKISSLLKKGGMSKTPGENADGDGVEQTNPQG